MAEDLTTSQRERQNILNNRYALAKAESHLALGGLPYDGESVFTKAQAAELFEVDDRTIERYLASNGDELSQNGCRLLKGKSLKNFKLAQVSDINVGDLAANFKNRFCCSGLLGFAIRPLNPTYMFALRHISLNRTRGHVQAGPGEKIGVNFVFD